jgi:hypothetical protein
MHHGVSAADTIPKIAPSRIVTVTGDEDWDEITAFGRESSFVAMMNLMMVGGSGYENMRMEPVKASDDPARHVMADADTPMGYMNSQLGAGDRMVNGTPSTDGDPGPPARPGDAEAHAHTAPPSAGEPAHPANAEPVEPAQPVEAAKPEEPAKDAGPIPAAPAGTALLTAAVPAPKVGKNVVDIRLSDAAGNPLAGAKITAEVNMANMDMGTARPPVTEVAPGRYQTTAAFTMRGPWRVVLKLTPKTGAPLSRSFDFRVK